jgi:mannose/fructose/N-acetylgalactosamine-specific phosphotransferase system component IID
MKDSVSKALKYISIGILAVPISIVAHELGHFIVYQLFGASNVQLHAFSVSADKESVSNLQNALAAITGPIISYVIVILAHILTTKNYQPFWIILAIGGLIGRLVNFIYIYFRTAGYNPNPNFDEFNFSKFTGIEPLFLSIITAILFVMMYAIFLKKAWKENGFKEIGLIAISIISGVAVWNFVGGVILP